MIIDSDGREIKLLIGGFCNLEGIFSNIWIQQKQKRQLYNYCLSLADEN